MSLSLKKSITVGAVLVAVTMFVSSLNAQTRSDVDALDRTIREVSSYLNERISRGDKVAFVSARQSFPILAEYIIENLIENAVNDRSFTVIDRAQLDAVRAELHFQTSGEVSDESVRSLGRIVGAKTIVTVAVSQIGQMYRFGIRALEVESAEIQGQINRNIPSGPTIDALAGAAAHAPTRSAPTTPQPAATRTTTTTPTGAVVTPPGNTLAEQLAFIERQAGRGTTYDIVVNADVELRPTSVATMGRDITVIIRSANPNNVRTIELDEDSQGHLLSVDANVTLRLQDIIIKGHANNNAALVAVGNARLILDNGAKITGNTNGFGTVGNNRFDHNAGNRKGAGVLIEGGVIEINSGSEISGNMNMLGYEGGGIYAENRATVNLRGGAISENGIRPNDRANGVGGGVLLTDNSTMNMSDGMISRNQAGYNGDGVYIWRNSTMTMTGGIISGNNSNGSGGGVYVSNEGTFTKRAADDSEVSGIIYGSTGQNANTARREGHAVIQMRAATAMRTRNTTLGAYDEITTTSSRGWE